MGHSDERGPWQLFSSWKDPLLHFPRQLADGPMFLSRPQGLSCLRLRMTPVPRWHLLGTLILNPFEGLLTSFLLKYFLSWDFCGNQMQKALRGLCVRF